MARNVELREFLRARRGSIQPAQAGLESAGQRRVTGLRREEVAMLAGVSVDYYVRLEQGRDVTPSKQVLDSIARVLRLTDPQKEHLYALVHTARAPAGEARRQLLRPNVLRLLDYLDTPAMVTGRGTAVLGANPLFSALITDFSRRPPQQQFYAHWLFADPMARHLLVDWEQFARETVGVLRADATRWPDDEDIRALIDELACTSDAFRALWAKHDAEGHTSGRKRYLHPLVGDLAVFHEVARLEDDQWLYLCWVERGSPSEQAIERLRATVPSSARQQADAQVE